MELHIENGWRDPSPGVIDLNGTIDRTIMSFIPHRFECGDFLWYLCFEGWGDDVREVGRW
jgi:hypothetical protein